MVGVLKVHVLQTGLQAGQVLVLASKYPADVQAERQDKVAQSRILSVKKLQQAKHFVGPISQSLQRVEHFWQDLVAESI